MASLSVLKSSMTLTIIMVSGLFFALLMVLVYLLLPGSGIIGWIIVILLVALFLLFQWALGPALVRMSTKLRYLKPGENPFLESIVVPICQKAGVPLPRLAIVQDPTPNAFVFGRGRGSATLAVHTGLLDRLNRQELEGVIAHEIGHVRHNDMVVMTMASAVPLIAYVIARGFLHGGLRGGGGDRDKSAAAIIVIAIVSWVIYFITQLLVLRLSRLREYYADSYAALVTGNPRGLSSALTKITYGLSLAKKGEPNGVRAFYIGDDATARQEVQTILQKKSQYDLDGDGVIDEQELEMAMEAEARSSWSRANGLMSTHPPTFRRILQLRQIEEELRMSGGKIDEASVYKHI